jgi:hypothetical protein
LGFQFACLHCISKNKCKDSLRPVYPSEEGIYYPIEMVEISAKHVEDLGTYVHEFTEASIIQILIRFRKDWNRRVEFKGYKSTYIAHIISIWGMNNDTCLEPCTRSSRPKW